MKLLPDQPMQGPKAEWTALFQQLVRYASVFEQEHALVDFIEAHLRACGVELHSVFFDAAYLSTLPKAQLPFSSVAGRRNLVALVRGSGGGRSIVLNCHLDVVPAGDETAWTYPPFSGHIEEGRIYGRGAYDDKAGVLICMLLLEILTAHRTQLSGDVLVHFVLEDESTGNGSLLCLDAGYVGDAAIILDGTRVSGGIDRHAGNCRLQIHFYGKPASVSVSHIGVNAAELLAELLIEMRSAVFLRNLDNEAPWTKFPSPNQFIVQSIHAEGAPLTVPALAQADVYITFPPPATLGDIRSVLESIAHTFAEKHALETPPRLDWSGFATEPVESNSEELIAVLEESAIDQGIGEIVFGPSTGTSDMRHFIASGIPCVLYGPGMGYNPHRANEYFEIASLPIMLGLFSRFISTWCA